MIKVNLLKNRAMQGEELESTSSISFDRGGNVDQKEAVIKIIFMVIFIVILIVFEKYNLNSANKEQRNYTLQWNKLNEEVKNLMEEADKIAGFEKQSEELENKMKIMKKLSKIRLRELKALDNLQTIIPSRVWLENLNYQNEQFKFQGYALTENDLNNFIQTMDKSVFFNEVILTQSKEESMSAGGSFKSFEINAVIGAVE